jgi:hypothetical protein
MSKGGRARRKFFGNGLPNKRPSRGEASSMNILAWEWDGQAQEGRHKVQPWKGSKEHGDILRWGTLGGNKTGRGNKK